MSVSSILAFVLAGAAAKAKSVQVARRSEDAELIGLRVDNADLRRRVAELEDAIATANAQARRDQELIDIWRGRALANIPAPQVAGPDFRPPWLAQAQAFQFAQQAAQQAQLGQQAQAQMAQYQGLQNYAAQQSPLGQQAQSLFNDGSWCNCVPARHDLFLRGE